MPQFSDSQKNFVFQRVARRYSWERIHKEFNQAFPPRTLEDLHSICYPSLHCAEPARTPLHTILEHYEAIERQQDQGRAQTAAQQPSKDPRPSMSTSAIASTVPKRPSACTRPTREQPLAAQASFQHGDAYHPSSGRRASMIPPEPEHNHRASTAECQTTATAPVPVIQGQDGSVSYSSRYEVVRAAAMWAATGSKRMSTYVALQRRNSGAAVESIHKQPSGSKHSSGPEQDD
ncbi:MAG: hypothetical protein M1823_001732 [Watsoniomyces obsoletus]|nr:MAG: hypothetical protein M1823_001732 [Watsoniomyces obsoletus]